MKRNKLFLGDDAGRTICPDGINKDSIVYSFGLGDNISFDLEIIKEYGCRVFGADPTPKSIAFLESQKLPDLFSYQAVAISDYDGEILLHFPKNTGHVSLTSADEGTRSGETQSFPCITVETFMSRHGHKHIDILKMDIKGPEFKIIPQLLKNNIDVRQIVLEFSPQCVENGNQQMKDILRLLEAHGYFVFHVEPNYASYDVSIIKAE